MTSSAATELSGLTPLHPVLPHAIIYTKPVCPKCDILKHQFYKRELTPVAIDITQTPEALTEFSQKLGLQATPIVLVHNVFEQPVFFWGKGAVPVDQGKILANALRERLVHLVADGYLQAQQADAYIGELARQALLNNDKKPYLQPSEYQHIAHSTVDASETKSRPVHLAPGNELTSKLADAPAVLMTH